MSTYDNKDHLIVYKYLRKYLDKMIKEQNKIGNEERTSVINDIKQECIIEILDNLEGK